MAFSTEMKAYLNKVAKQFRVHAGTFGPSADFTFVPTNLLVQFTNTSTDDTDLTYEWDFGDEGSSTTTSPQHTYAGAGTYDVTLTATDEDGQVGTVTKQVTVEAE